MRDWLVNAPQSTIFPYDEKLKPSLENTAILKVLWPHRTHLWLRREPNGNHIELGLTWYEWSRFLRNRFRTPLSIVFAFVATHNHFVLDRGGKVFNRSAPVIKLPADASEDDHLALLGLLNSSTACFWMKQTFYPKGGDHVGQEGARVRRTLWDERYEFAGTGLLQFPLTTEGDTRFSRTVDNVANDLSRVAPTSLLQTWGTPSFDPSLLGAFAPLRETSPGTTSLRPLLDAARARHGELLAQMIALQEELDWHVYRLYDLLDDDLTLSDSVSSVPPWFPPSSSLPPLRLGQRAFEIVLARNVRDGKLQTTWFERHRSTPITDLPDHWPAEYRALVERRIALIESDPNIRLLEQPEYKRRWNTEPWGSQLERALREWLLHHLETYFDFDGRMTSSGSVSSVPPWFPPSSLVSVGKLSDVARQDAAFMEVAEVYRDDPAFDVQALVAELVEAESVPALPVLRYKPAGLRKRADWERTWELQREEDRRAGEPRSHGGHGEQPGKEAALEIPVPPKYKSSDFLKASYWRLRGKLDVPKERWISYPHCEGEDGTLMVAWAGYDHLQQAQAISGHYVDVQERLGGRDDPRLIPLLACLVELVPWLKQWHNEVDPEFGMAMGDYFEGFVTEEARNLGKTPDEIRAWDPPAKKRGRKGAKKKG